MYDDSAFIAAIIAKPDDDLPRLIFADALDERGDPRGEFIRVQCELAQLIGDGSRCPVCDWTMDANSSCQPDNCAYRPSEHHESHGRWYQRQTHYHELRRRERELLEQPCYGTHGQSNWCVWSAGVTPPLSSASGLLAGQPFYFRRGFVESVTLSGDDWLRHANALTAAAPIREVRLTAWPNYGLRQVQHLVYANVADADPSLVWPSHGRDHDDLMLALRWRHKGITFVPPPETVTVVDPETIFYREPPESYGVVFRAREGRAVAGRPTVIVDVQLPDGRRHYSMPARPPLDVGDLVALGAGGWAERWQSTSGPFRITGARAVPAVTVPVLMAATYRAGVRDGATFTRDNLDTIVRNFDNSSLTVPIVNDTGRDRPAGRITGLRRDGDFLLADIDADHDAAAAIRSARFDTISAEVFADDLTFRRVTFGLPAPRHPAPGCPAAGP